MTLSLLNYRKLFIFLKTATTTKQAQNFIVVSFGTLISFGNKHEFSFMIEFVCLTVYLFCLIVVQMKVEPAMNVNSNPLKAFSLYTILHQGLCLKTNKLII